MKFFHINREKISGIHILNCTEKTNFMAEVTDLEGHVYIVQCFRYGSASPLQKAQTCRACFKHKPLDQFRKMKSGRYTQNCIDCSTKYQANRRKTDKKKKKGQTEV